MALGRCEFLGDTIKHYRQGQYYWSFAFGSTIAQHGIPNVSSYHGLATARWAAYYISSGTQDWEGCSAFFWEVSLHSPVYLYDDSKISLSSLTSLLRTELLFLMAPGQPTLLAYKHLYLYLTETFMSSDLLSLSTLLAWSSIVFSSYPPPNKSMRVILSWGLCHSPSVSSASSGSPSSAMVHRSLSADTSLNMEMYL